MLKVDSHFINADYSAQAQLNMMQAFSLWGTLQRQSEFTSLMNMISHGNAVKSKILDIPVGDSEIFNFKLNANTTIPATGSTFNLVIPTASDPKFVPGDTVQFIDSASANHVALGRIAALGVTSGATVTYSNVVVVYNSAAGAYAATTTTCYVAGEAYNYDATAPIPSDRMPGKIRNVMQDFRKTFAKGNREQSDQILFDSSLDHLSLVEMNDFMRKYATSLYFNENYQLPNNADYGVMKGLMGFIKDGGQKFITPGASLSYDTLLDFTAKFDKGSDQKALIASPATMNKFLKVFRNVTNIQKTEFSLPNSPIMWSGLSVDLAYGSLLLMPDRTFNSRVVSFNDGTTDYTGTDFAMVVDLAHTRTPVLDVTNEGPKTISVKDVTLANNDTRKMKEIETISTLVVDDPAVNGIIGLSS